MFISELTLKNFRGFGSNSETIRFNPGLNLIVGENDSGKSAIMEALKIMLGSTDLGWYRIQDSDFFNEDTSRKIELQCKFENLSAFEKAVFLEYLTYESDETSLSEPCLYVNWKCEYLQRMTPPRPIVKITSGKNGDSPSLPPEAKELLRVTHLKALRDAYSDMQSGRNSRLSQVMQNIPDLNIGDSNYTDGTSIENLSLTGIFDLSNKLLEEYKPLKDAGTQMSTILREKMLLEGDSIATRFEVSGTNTTTDSRKISSLLEKLDLVVDKERTTLKGMPGLGTSNIMSMACELLLKKNVENTSQFLLIEEPEAHIHAQRQSKLIKSLQKEAETENQQIIMTTHSPLLASVVKLQNIILLKDGTTYSLEESFTKLDEEGYLFLEKYLDATKANLFFARSVMIVEGPGEALLMPTLSKILARDFTDFGVSIVDVRGTGLRRYAKIFQRNTSDKGEYLNVNVACVTDSDIMPDCGPRLCIDEKYKDDGSNWPEKTRRQWKAEKDFDDECSRDYHLAQIYNKAEGQNVKTFVSNKWTLEYDLAYYGLVNEVMQEILVNSLVKSSYSVRNHSSKIDEINEKIQSLDSIEEKAAYFYSFFSLKNKSKANFTQWLSIQLEESSEEEHKRRGIIESLPPYLADSIYYVTGECISREEES